MRMYQLYDMKSNSMLYELYQNFQELTCFEFNIKKTYSEQIEYINEK